MAIDDVTVFVKDLPNPEIKKALERERELASTVLTKRRQYAQTVPKYAERYPSVLDFYDSYDPFEVTEAELEAFDGMMEEVSDKHRPFFSTQHYYNRLLIANRTGMPTPVILLVTYADRTTENIEIPADVWRKKVTHLKSF